MRKQASLLIALALLATGRLLGQAVARPEEIRPKTCPLSDSLLAPATDRPKAKIMSVATPDGRGLLTGGAPIPKAQPVRAFQASALYTDSPGPIGPELSFQLEISDYKTRPLAEAVLVLTIDDSLAVNVGQMQGRPNLVAGLSPKNARQLARATSVTGKLGSTPFSLDDRGLDAIRAVYVAATCGPKSH